MSKQKTAPSVKWFNGEKIDAKIAIIVCLSMIEKALKAINKANRK